MQQTLLRKKPLAVFDIDGTIFRSSLLVELTEVLVAQGFFPKTVHRYIRQKQQMWSDRQGTYDEYIMAVVRVFKKHIAGIPIDTLQKASREVIANQKNKVYVYTRNLVKKLLRTHHLLAISGSPQEVVELFISRWKFAAGFGAQYETSNKRYTGKVLRDPVLDKSKILESYLQSHAVTLQASVGVGDTASDAAFLSRVDTPIAFNPNAQLYQIAKRNNWQIIVERKDVIYKI